MNDPGAPHLFVVTVGPVQEFIVAARRTRDLWFGSYLLSEVSKAAAKTIADRGGTLIFPAPPNTGCLAPGSAFSVANVILAKLEGGTDPGTLLTRVRVGCRRLLKDIARQSFGGMPPGWFDRARFDAQLSDWVEIYAACLPLRDEHDYPQQRAKLMRLLAGRKACRDFAAWQGVAGVPKSSLDGARETVLTELGGPDSLQRARRLKLSDGEQLDAIGLLKRQGGGLRQYPSVARVAADTWLRGLPPKDLEKLCATCAPLAGHGLVQLPEARFPQFAGFPYEGIAVYETRYPEAVEEAPEDQQPGLLRPLRELLSRLHKEHGEPTPYLAILVADGDKMGRALSAIDNIEAHQAFSAALSQFAGLARETIIDFGGVAVYTGGDDVLAFVPVDRALQCARQLRESFNQLLQDQAPEPPTLSVGIAVGHMMEPLEDLLEYGRKAEKAAKGTDDERDGLAVGMYPRAGSPSVYRAQWDSKPDALLLGLAELHLRGLIPDKAAYDLNRLADFYVRCEGDEWCIPAMKADAMRLLRRKEIESLPAFRQIESVIETADRPEQLAKFTVAIIIARRLATALRQAGQAAAPIVQGDAA